MPPGIFDRFLDDIPIVLAVRQSRGDHAPERGAFAHQVDARLIELIALEPLLDLRQQLRRAYVLFLQRPKPLADDGERGNGA